MLRTSIILINLLLLAFQALSAPAPQTPSGMKTYQFVFLRTGPNKEVPPAEAEKMQQGHLDGLVKLNRERINLLFGPILGQSDLRGIAVLDVSDAEAARKSFAGDPYIKGGHLVADVKPWLCETNRFSPPTTPLTPEPLVLGFLMKGPNRQQPEDEAAKIQSGHLAYMEGLGKIGKLLVAGPFAEDSNWRGVVIYRVGTLAEAKELAAGDPAVKAGRLAIDAWPWMTFKGILK